MSIGTGIAIAGVWIFAAIFAQSRTTTNIGAWIAISIAITTTIILK